MTWGAFWVAYRNGVNRAATNSVARTRNAANTNTTRASSTQTTTATAAQATQEVKKPQEVLSFWERPLDVSAKAIVETDLAVKPNQ
jgi:hypothetical protein